MTLSYWSFPTRIIFGSGAVQKLGPEALRLSASRTLVVTDRGVVAAKLHEPVVQSLSDAGIESTIFCDVSPNPVEKNIVDGVSAYSDSQANFIVALGGGSALDAAKLIRLKAYPGVHDRTLEDYDDAKGGDAYITPKLPPMIALPTTAGTGSEVGRSGVVTLDSNHRKTVIFSPYLIANVAILDPELTRSMPAPITAATGFDALTHCVESYLSLGDNPMADAIALGGLRLIADSLRIAVREPNNIEARGAMMKAAMMGAIAFQKGLGVCHSLAHPLSSECGIHHGLANALCLPAVIDFNAEVASERIAEVASAMRMPKTPSDFAQALRALRDTLGLGNGLSAAGVQPEQLPVLAAKALEDACHRSNPRPCNYNDMAALYQASMLKRTLVRLRTPPGAQQSAGQALRGCLTDVTSDWQLGRRSAAYARRGWGPDPNG